MNFSFYSPALLISQFSLRTTEMSVIRKGQTGKNVIWSFIHVVVVIRICIIVD
jgi:hypothetical protein